MKNKTYFYFFTTILFCNLALADSELKLICRMSIEARDSMVGSEKINREILVEVNEINSDTYILSNDELIGSVSTTRKGIVLSVDNFSTANKWDITTKVRTARGGVLTNQIILDRNTGKMIFNSELDKNYSVYATGNCSKVDVNKKLF